MKKILTVLLLALSMSSCETLFTPVTFKVIGSGTFNVGLSEDGSYSSGTYPAQSFKSTSEGVLVFSAQSTTGKGCTVEAWVGNDKVRSSSASGYGVASVTVEN